MPANKTIHYNPPGDRSRTRCGRRLGTVEWRTDPADVTCNSCSNYIKVDKGRGA